MSTQVQVTVELNQKEAEMVSKLPEALRGQVTESILSAKREAMAALITNRSTFSININDGGTIVIRGLGNRYPTGLRHDQIEMLLSHVPELQKAVEQAKSYIANNPEKVAAFEKARAEKRAKETKIKAAVEKQLKLVVASN